MAPGLRPGATQAPHQASAAYQLPVTEPTGSSDVDELATLRSDGDEGSDHLRVAVSSSGAAASVSATRTAASLTERSDSRPSATDAMQAITTPRPVKLVLGAAGHGLFRAGRDAVAAAAHLVVR